MPKAKASIEKEETKEVKLSKEESLEEGRYIGTIARHRPEVMQKLEALATATRKKKIEIVSEALDLYYEMQSMHGLWEIISTMSPEQLQASWQLFRYLLKLARDIYVDVGKEFIEGAVARYVELIESARASGFEMARKSFEVELERRREEKMSKLMEKLDPLLDALVDWMVDRMVAFMFPSRKTKIKVPVEIEESGSRPRHRLPVEVEE